MALNYHPHQPHYSNNSVSTDNSTSPYLRTTSPNTLGGSAPWPESSDGGCSNFVNFGACRVTLDVGGKTFVTLLHTLAKDMNSLLGKVALELSHTNAASRAGVLMRSFGSASPKVGYTALTSAFQPNFIGLLYAHGIIIDPSTLHVFIDRDPAAFAHILNCLRNMPASTTTTATALLSSSTPLHTSSSSRQATPDQPSSSSANSQQLMMIIPPIPLDMFEAVLAEARFFRLYDLYTRLQEHYTQLRRQQQAETGGTAVNDASGSTTATGNAQQKHHSALHSQHHDLLSTALDELRQLRQAIRDVQLCVTRSYDNGRFWVRA